MANSSVDADVRFGERMVMRTRGQVRMSLAMLAVLNRLPGKDRMMARVVAPIHRAATAIILPDYPVSR
jgi:hypothetical protein